MEVPPNYKYSNLNINLKCYVSVQTNKLNYLRMLNLHCSLQIQ